MFIILNNSAILWVVLDNVAIFWPMPLFLFLNTQTMHIKSIVHNNIAMNSYKILHPGGIRTRVFCSRGECDVDCATPSGHVANFSKLFWSH
jgi:hypothetical protein